MQFAALLCSPDHLPNAKSLQQSCPSSEERPFVADRQQQRGLLALPMTLGGSKPNLSPYGNQSTLWVQPLSHGGHWHGHELP